MATEKEQTLTVEDFLGIDRQVQSEDTDNLAFHTLQNVFEKKLGALEKRGGSDVIRDSWPSNITGIDNHARLYVRDIEKKRILAIHCTPPATAPIDQTNPTGYSFNFVNSGTGNWGRDWGGGVYTGMGDSSQFNVDISPSNWSIVLQAVGYGVRQNIYLTLTGTTLQVNSVLRIIIPSLIDENIFGFNVYIPQILSWETFSVVRTQNSLTWVGYIDLLGNPGVTQFDFSQAPRVGGAPFPPVDFDVGGITPTYTIAGTSGGSLTPGKTYYVAVMSQRRAVDVTAAGLGQQMTNAFARWEILASAGIAAITLEAGETAISVANIVGTSTAYAVAIGESEESLAMQFITNTSGATILDINKSSSAIVMKNNNAPTTSDFLFLYADPSNKDMLVAVDDDGTISPIPVSNLTATNSAPAKVVLTGSADLGGGSGPYFEFPVQSFDYWALTVGSTTIPSVDFLIGEGAKYRFVAFQDKLFFVNDSASSATSVSSVPSGTYSSFIDTNTRNESGLFETDGYVSRLLGYDYGTSSPPRSKFISVYQESLVIGGGSQFSESFNKVFFSNALNPYNFSQTGSGADLAFIVISQTPEAVSNVGIYSFGTGVDGPRSQLLITKKNSLWALTDLPTDFTSQTFMTSLSARVGSVGATIVNTPIGTLFASKENVYIVDSNGEPVPIGDGIESILRESYMENAWACFHKNHYKLSFASSEDSGNDLELWLDIRKTKALKGRPVWYGPHIGRELTYSNNEYLVDDSDDRVISDITEKRLYFTDTEDIPSDFGAAVKAKIVTKEYKLEPAQMANKLMTRFYWKLKVMRPTSLTDTTTIDAGAQEETQVLEVAPPDQATWDQSSFVMTIFDSAWHALYPYFYQNRLVGRTVQKTLEHDAIDNVSISGLALLYKVETRRL
jgi:hypothetical protein